MAKWSKELKYLLKVEKQYEENNILELYWEMSNHIQINYGLYSDLFLNISVERAFKLGVWLHAPFEISDGYPTIQELGEDEIIHKLVKRFRKITRRK